MKKDIDLFSLILQKEEVESVSWLSLQEIEELINSGEFYKNHIEAVDILKKYVDM